MFVYEPMLPEDIFSLDLANLDRKSENFTFEYYLSYLQHHPYDFFTIRQAYPEATGRNSEMLYTSSIIAYIFGKKEMKEKLCLHLSAISVAPSYRAMKLGTLLLEIFETAGDAYGAYFTDLFVRASNQTAIRFYERNGYKIYRKIFDYYGTPEEDAYDMRKSLSKDPLKQMMINGVNVHSRDL